MRRRHEGTTTQRGYGYHFQQLRKSWKRIVDAGDAHCGHCGRWINPDEPWDLAHPFDDKSQRPGPWHRACNRRYALLVTRPKRLGKPPTTTRRNSRIW